MRVTLSLPTEIARRFQATVPPRQRSRLVARLLAEELQKRERALAAACVAANKDKPLAAEIDEWQQVEDGLTE